MSNWSFNHWAQFRPHLPGTRSLGRCCALIAGIVFALLPLIGSGAFAAEQIVISDPAGDVVVGGVPLGAAGAAYDLREVSLRQEGGFLRIAIQVEAAPESHVSAEFGVVFRVDHQWFMGGYTALPYPGTPPYYQGGFACPSTEDGFVNGTVATDCLGLSSWSMEEATYKVDVPLAFLNATHGTIIQDVWGFAEVTPYSKEWSRVDTTSREGWMRLSIPATSGSDGTADDDGPTRTTPTVPIWVLIAVVVVFTYRYRGRHGAVDGHDDLA